MKRLKCTIAQIHPKVGDVEGNCKLILDHYHKAVAQGVDIIVFPELITTGYSPEDLLQRSSFVDEIFDQMGSIIAATNGKDTAIILGSIYNNEGELYNAGYFIFRGQILSQTLKTNLPNYGVFDEKRYFKEGGYSHVVEFKSLKLGLIVCEDMWFGDNVFNLSQEGAELIIVINASPYEYGKHGKRIELAKNHCLKNDITLLYANLVGGHDSLVFDGASFVVSNDGERIIQYPFFSVGCENFVLEFDKSGKAICNKKFFAPEPQTKASMNYQAILLGLKSYVYDNGFEKVVLGVSGGIDSAITAALAVDALGKDRVIGVTMPSQFSSEETFSDAAELIKNLGIETYAISIEEIYLMIKQIFNKSISNLESYKVDRNKLDIMEQNFQARIRGMLLMAHSNATGHLLLTTGNKSEYACGYATLYGDMCGGFNLIKDLYKMEVYELAKYRNELGFCIPINILLKEPTAELKFRQKDSDSLPPYDVLDIILNFYIEENMSANEIVSKTGYQRELVERVVQMIAKSQYKRKQAAPGIKLSKCSFDFDRRYPITNYYRR